jgi:hypothetical protein
MRSFKMIFSSVMGVLLLGLQVNLHAALLGVGTFSSGFGPDFNVSTGITVGYAYSGIDGVDGSTGVLKIESTVSDVSFLEGQLDATWESKYGRTSLNVSPATAGDDKFYFELTIDSSGNIVAGANTVTMNGKVRAFDATVPGLFSTASSANGTVLDGNLIVGGTVTQLGWQDDFIDFIGSIDNSSLLTTAGYGAGLSGVLNINGITTTSGAVEWNRDWTGDSSSTLDVVVPVPAAVWLFLSGLTGLITISRKQ